MQKVRIEGLTQSRNREGGKTARLERCTLKGGMNRTSTLVRSEWREITV